MASASLASTPRIAAPSPSRSNPFARPALPKSGSFTRSCLLPTLPSPVKPRVDSTPDGKSTSTTAVGSVGKSRSAWRMLWRGGLEIGQEGYRLDGVTFFALLNFPSTPSGPISNPFDVPQTPSQPTSAMSQSPFALPSADTDICLSLESMRGRKYLQVRGLTDLAESEVLESSDSTDGGGVHMAIAPSAPLLVAYFSGLLCRDPKLSEGGRTRKAVLVGLGDDDSPQNTLLVYGQLQPDSTLRLLVSRRKPPAPPPSEIKIKPGEPLPRAPLFFPVKTRKPLPFPNRSTLAKSRSFSRTSSLSSIYAPPILPSHHSAPILPTTSVQPHAPVSGRTPGRRGEKRPRSGVGDEERKRKAGRVILVKEEVIEDTDTDTLEDPVEVDTLGVSKEGGEEDIFGKTSTNIVAGPSSDIGGEASASGKKRARVPQQVLDNKAMIRKQAMVMMESRGFPRDHDIFKDVFGITIKGVYFVFRDSMLDAPLDKPLVQSYINKHLDMYLPLPLPTLPTRPEGSEASGEDTAVDVDEESSLLTTKAENIKSDSEQEDGEDRGDGDEVDETDRRDMTGILTLNEGLLEDEYDEREGYRGKGMKRTRGMEVVQEEDEGED